MLNECGLAYLHIDWAGDNIKLTGEFRTAMRERFSRGALICFGHYTAGATEDLIEKGLGGGAAFSRPYIANPDLVERFRTGAALDEPDASTFHGGDEYGYTDCPFMDERVSA